MQEKLLKVLEFDEVRKRLARYAVSDCGKRAILSLLPASDYFEIQQSLSLTAEAYAVKNKYLVNPISEFDDIAEILNKAKAGAVLRPGELLKAAHVLRSARIAKSEISALGDDIEGLKALVASIVVDRNLETQISDAVASENELRDDASDKLRDLRRKIHSTNARLKEKLAGYTRASNVSKYLQDNLVTVRMGRFVLPVKSECRSMIPGLIHDQSSSGSTVFIEPFPVVELNNELRYLQMEEQREIERILSVLSEYVANGYDMLHFALMQCTMLDVIFAKSACATDFHGTIPILNRRGILSVKNARHPLIDPKKVVPVSLETGATYDML
ncbi:MAG: endonuclease MutS2, partial [Clostridiales bacterium]|nr:endonuclease MutS2 [Clostridiales bacterium]